MSAGATTHRVVKLAGVGSIGVEEVPVPAPGEGEVLVRLRRSLISRGSEIGRRYLAEEALDHRIMGYSAAGEIAALGAGAEGFDLDQPVVAVAPHAGHVVADPRPGDGSWVMPLADGLSFDHATFHPLLTSALMWAENAAIRPGETVAILGQGLVGLLMLQTVRAFAPRSVIAVEALPRRCALAAELGADTVLSAAEGDPVERVMALTGGRSADVVLDCVGGTAGIRSFEQAMAMSRDGGRVMLIALYQGAPLPLDAGRLQRRTLLGGFCHDQSRRPFAERAMTLLAGGEIRVEPLITHHFPGTEAKAAFDLLYERPGEAVGVMLDWA
jgi:threonine dehydrogenase-like Zn-dependent dehydrogenase